MYNPPLGLFSSHFHPLEFHLVVPRQWSNHFSRLAVGTKPHTPLARQGKARQGNPLVYSDLAWRNLYYKRAGMQCRERNGECMSVFYFYFGSFFLSFFLPFFLTPLLDHYINTACWMDVPSFFILLSFLFCSLCWVC